MKAELAKLIILQKTDTHLRILKEEIESAEERRASLENEFEQHAFQVREIQNNLETAKTARVDLERQAEEAKIHLERADRNLKSAQNQKEYEAAMRELDSLQKQISTLETQILEKMNEVEAAEKVVEEHAEEIASLDSDHQASIAKFEEELQVARQEFEKESAKREEVFVTLPENLASIYDRFAKRSSDGIAVSEVKGGACSECFISLRPQILVEIKKGDRIITCESCQRILYFEIQESLEAIG